MINKYASFNGINSQVALQNYMFECFLDRLSNSAYSEKFILKGGLLISSLIGISTRTTMDIDMTIKNYSFTMNSIKEIIINICNVDVYDSVVLSVSNISPIRKEFLYGGFRIGIVGKVGKIITSFHIDVSTGETITPKPIMFEFSSIINLEKKIRVLSYNIETILSEKIETILSRSVFNTRMKDFYDFYMIKTTKEINNDVLREALINTMKCRNSLLLLEAGKDIINTIESSSQMNKLWKQYQLKFSYSKDISFKNILSELLHCLEKI